MPLFLKRSAVLDLTGWNRRKFLEVFTAEDSPIRPAFRLPGPRGDVYVSAVALGRYLQQPELELEQWLREPPLCVGGDELAQMCGFHRQTLATLREAGIITPLQPLKGHPRYPKAQLAALAGL